MRIQILMLGFKGVNHKRNWISGVEWKVMSFRQLISKEIAHKMEEADINEADEKSMSPPR